MFNVSVCLLLRLLRYQINTWRFGTASLHAHVAFQSSWPGVALAAAMALTEALMATWSAQHLSASLARHVLVHLRGASVSDKDVIENKVIVQEVLKHYPDSVPRASDLSKVFMDIDGKYEHKMCHHQHLRVDMEALGALCR